MEGEGETPYQLLSNRISLDTMTHHRGTRRPASSAPRPASSAPTDYQQHHHRKEAFSCNYCQGKFFSLQALGGHQNAHKHERTVAKRRRDASTGINAVVAATPSSPAVTHSWLHGGGDLWAYATSPAASMGMGMGMGMGGSAGTRRTTTAAGEATPEMDLSLTASGGSRNLQPGIHHGYSHEDPRIPLAPPLLTAASTTIAHSWLNGGGDLSAYATSPPTSLSMGMGMGGWDGTRRTTTDGGETTAEMDLSLKLSL